MMKIIINNYCFEVLNDSLLFHISLFFDSFNSTKYLIKVTHNSNIYLCANYYQIFLLKQIETLDLNLPRSSSQTPIPYVSNFNEELMKSSHLSLLSSREYFIKFRSW